MYIKQRAYAEESHSQQIRPELHVVPFWSFGVKAVKLPHTHTHTHVASTYLHPLYRAKAIQTYGYNALHKFARVNPFSNALYVPQWISTTTAFALVNKFACNGENRMDRAAPLGCERRCGRNRVKLPLINFSLMKLAKRISSHPETFGEDYKNMRGAEKPRCARKSGGI